VADLICYLPAHGYSDDNPVFVSWLGGTYYVYNKDTNSFKLATSVGGSLVQYTETITDGYVRQVDTTDGTITTITGLEHLEGENVLVTSGGSLVGLYPVSGGSITIPDWVYSYQVGLPYAMKVKTTRLEIPNSSGIQSRIKNINELVVRHVKSSGGQAGQEKNGVEYLNDLECTYSEKSDDATVNVRGGLNDDGYIVVTSADPYPMTVLATIVSFSVDESR